MMRFFLFSVLLLASLAQAQTEAMDGDAAGKVPVNAPAANSGHINAKTLTDRSDSVEPAGREPASSSGSDAPFVDEDITPTKPTGGVNKNMPIDQD